MSDQNVFGENKPEVTPQEAPQVNQQQQAPNVNELFADQLAAIRNEEGKPKYDSVEKAIEALKHSQQYIPELKREKEKLEAELEELRAKSNKFESAEELLKRFEAAKERGQEPPAQTGLDEQSVLALLEKREQAKQQQENEQLVNKVLVEKFGDKAGEIVKAKAKELDMTPAELGQLARNNPKLVLGQFNVQPQHNSKPNTSSQNTSSLVNQNNESGLQRPEKSLLAGATTAEVTDYMKKIKEDTYKRLGIEL